SDRDVESLLWTLEQFFRQIAMEDSSQEPLALASANLESRRDAPGELDHTVVEKRTPRLETCGHAGAVELDQDVSRQILRHVAIDDPTDDVAKRRNGFCCWSRQRLRHDRGFIGRYQPLVKVVFVVRGEQAREPLNTRLAQCRAERSRERS